MKTSVSMVAAAMFGPLVMAGVLTVGGCHRQPAAPIGGPAHQPGIDVLQARFVLPAVKGNPGAAYFTLGNDTAAPATLIKVDIIGAKNAEMHETSGGTMQQLSQVRIEPGQRAVFAPAGKHVMAFSPSPTLSPGGSSEIVFHFADGKTKSAPLRIEAAGSDMAGMNMGGKN